jgi:hypothetical protein
LQQDRKGCPYARFEFENFTMTQHSSQPFIVGGTYTDRKGEYKYWTGHAKSTDGEVVRQTVTDKYVKMAKDTKFRADVAERIGLGFDLPKVGPKLLQVFQAGKKWRLL